jgi:hypothetical protein
MSFLSLRVLLFNKFFLFFDKLFRWYDQSVFNVILLPVLLLNGLIQCFITVSSGLIGVLGI